MAQMLCVTRWNNETVILGISLSVEGSAKFPVEEEVKDNNPNITAARLLWFLLKQFNTAQGRIRLKLNY